MSRTTVDEGLCPECKSKLVAQDAGFHDYTVEVYCTNEECRNSRTPLEVR